MGMPVFCGDFEGEGEGEEGVDGWDYVTAGGDCEAAVLLNGEILSKLL